MADPINPVPTDNGGDTLDVPPIPAPPSLSTFNSSAWDAALKWLAKGGAGRKCCTLSPMDEMMYFQTPYYHVEDVSDGLVHMIAQANPMRVVLLFASPYAPTAYHQIAPSPALKNDGTEGINVSYDIPPLIITQAAHGVLCQCEWYGYSVGEPGSQLITVIEVLLKQWSGT